MSKDFDTDETQAVFDYMHEYGTDAELGDPQDLAEYEAFGWYGFIKGVKWNEAMGELRTNKKYGYIVHDQDGVFVILYSGPIDALEEHWSRLEDEYEDYLESERRYREEYEADEDSF